MKRKAILFTLLLLLLLVQGVQAMSSTNFSLDWFTPLTSGGGGPANSAHYAADVTVGQTVIGASSSTNFRAGLGYWYGLVQQISYFFNVYLPSIIK